MKSDLRNSLLHLVPLIARRPTRRPQKIERLLLIRPDHLGDILFATPALRLLRSSLPETHITALVGPWARAVLESNPNVDEILTCDFPWFNRRRRSSVVEPYATLKELVKTLRRGSYDASINLRFDFWWGALATYLAGIPMRVGYDIDACQPFLTHPIGYTMGRHEVEQNISLIERFLDLPEVANLTLRYLNSRAAGNHVSEVKERLEFVIRAEDDEFVANYLAGRGVALSDRLVALQPGSGSRRKEWTVDRFALLGTRLTERLGCTIIITGAPADRAIVNEIAARIGDKAIAAAGDTTLGQLGALLTRCALAIGVDNGGMHLAVAVETPTVHLFGPSDQRLFGPYGDVESHRIVRAGRACNPCGEFDFSAAIGPGDCMMAITVDQVLSEAMGLILGDNREANIE